MHLFIQVYVLHLVRVGITLTHMTGLQEHYCVSVGINDATGAFRQFGFAQVGQQQHSLPNAD